MTLTYDAIHKLVLDATLPPELVALPWVAVARGGLPLATMLAIKYDKRFKVLDPHDVEGGISCAGLSGDVLLIDDVFGTGQTKKMCESLLPADATARWCLLIDDTSREIHPNWALLNSALWYALPWEPNGV